VNLSSLATVSTCLRGLKDNFLRGGILVPQEEFEMAEKETLEAAQRDLREGKSPSRAAGEFVREEIEHVREGKHGARSPKQAIAIGLSKARRAGIPLGTPNPETSPETRRKAAKDSQRGRENPVRSEEGSTPRGRARLKTMQSEPKNTTSHGALSRQAKSVARERGSSARSASAKKAARTRSREQAH
jgi:hypothetical protein